MSKVAIVTDSTSYIPLDISRNLPIYTLPLHLIWGSENLKDGVDIQPAEFYERLKTAKVMPTTSQVTPGAFLELYKRLVAEGYDVLSIHISGKLSGTLDSAVQAKSHIPTERIELYDSESASMALGFIVMAVARAAAQGASLDECRTIADQARGNTDVFFAVNTLEFLRRGGRIGGASAFVGTALNLKPILTLKEGRVEAIDKVRTMSKTIDRLMQYVDQGIAGKRPIRLAALHAQAPQEARDLLERIRQCYPVGDVSDAFITELSPVVGAHTGPGTLGLAYMAGM